MSEAGFDRDIVQAMVELRGVVASAPTIGDAWKTGLELVGRTIGCRAAVVWEQRGSEAMVNHAWAAEHAAEPLVASRRSVTCEAPTTSALGKRWVSGDAASSLVGDVCDDPELSEQDRRQESLLIPVRSQRSSVAVVELVQVATRAPTELVVAVVAQLGDTILQKQLEEQLELAEDRFQLTFDAAAIGMALVATDGTFLAANQALCEFLGRSEQELRERGFQEVTYPPDLAIDEELVAEVLAGTRSSYQLEKRYVHANGEMLWALLSVSLVRDHEGEPLHFISQINDIHLRKNAEIDMRRAVATFRAAFDDSGIGMALVHSESTMSGLIIEANEAFAKITGLTKDELRTRLLDDVIELADPGLLATHLSLIGAVDAPTHHDELRTIRPDGSPGWIRVVLAPVRDDAAGSKLAVLQVEDVTDERHAQEQLAYIAGHDYLTRLPNRAFITDCIRDAQQRSESIGHHVGILFIDLDKFKDINDSLGHDAGDQLLTEVAARLGHMLRPSDTAARMGGDEFVVLCDDLADDIELATRELERVSERLHDTLRAPIEIDGTEVVVSASIGMNIVQGTSDEVRTTLSNADTAMYRAKAGGRARSEHFDAESPSEPNE